MAQRRLAQPAARWAFRTAGRLQYVGQACPAQHVARTDLPQCYGCHVKADYSGVMVRRDHPDSSGTPPSLPLGNLSVPC